MQGPYSTEKEYNKLLLEQITQDFLRQGIIPSYEQLITELRLRIDRDTLGNGPLTDLQDIEISEREESSVSKFSKFTTDVCSDLRVAYNSIIDINERVNSYYDSSSYDIVSLSQLAHNTELVIRDGSKFSGLDVAYTVGSDLTTLDLVDQSRTTAHVDTLTPSCELEKTNMCHQKFYISGSSVKLAVSTENQLVSHGFADNDDINTALEDIDRPYLYLVKTLTQQYPVTLDVIVDIREYSKHRRAITQITGELSGSDGVATPTSLVVSHSIDGYNFTEINSGVFDNKFVFIFDEIATNFIKVSIVKSMCDDVWLATDNIYVYEFSLTNISVYYTKYYYTSSLVTKPLYVLDANYDRRLFDSVKLIVDESYNTTKPWEEQTGIQYYISIDKDESNNLTYESFIPITPNNKLDLNIMRNEVVGISIDPASIYDSTAFINVPLKDLYVGDTFILWRNVGIPATNTRTYHGESTGWHKDASYYKCIFKVGVDSGVIINFGENGAVVDGEYVGGATYLKFGYHKFKTHEKNWVAVIASSDEKSDPLYPYNHKLLIEGHPNIPVYKGMEFYTSYKMVKVGKFDFFNNVKRNDFEKYYFDETNGRIYIKIPSNEDYECTQRTLDYKMVRELFLLDYKYKRSDNVWKNVDMLALKAVLKTTNDCVTPTLRNYKLHLTYR